ncbi:MAG: hypothetical protein KAS59_02885 [Alphaproteobacteria bacterium]|nr:hypothetical protein [Alphaproteobacteria bacterium]
MTEKEIIGGLSVVVGMICSVVYIWGIYKGTTKPHLFSWLIWGIVMSIAFAVQVVEKAGPGAWNLGRATLVAFFIVGVSFFCGEKHITKSDWMAFIIALLAIPVWKMTGNPLLAIMIVSIIEVAAFYPTFRKSWMKPWEEPALAYFIGAMQFSLSLFALEKVTPATTLYPVVAATLNLLLIIMLLWRRKVLV